MSALSPDHIAAYIALYQMDGPWDGSRHDYYHAQTCSVLAGCFGKSPPPPREYVIRWDERSRAQTEISFDTAFRVLRSIHTK